MEEIGCTIMSDGWRDRANRDLVNVLVNCPKGFMFIETIDLSSVPKTADRLFVFLDKYMESVGEANVVQVITDNALNYVLAGKMLMAKRKHLFWSPYAARSHVGRHGEDSGDCKSFAKRNDNCIVHLQACATN